MTTDNEALAAIIQTHTGCLQVEADMVAEQILNSKWLKDRDLRAFAAGEQEGRRRGVMEGERAGRYRGIATGMLIGK